MWTTDFYPADKVVMPTNTATMAPRKGEKGMRKGTKSCVECRKRKVKCVFRSETSETCATCSTRGLECILQTQVPHRVVVAAALDKSNSGTTLEDRVAQLEALIRSQTTGDVALSRHQNPSSTQGSPGSSEDRESHQQESFSLGSPIQNHQSPIDTHTDIPLSSEPAGSLFNNAIWRVNTSGSRIPSSISNNSHSPDILQNSSLAKDSRVCDDLCKDLLPPRLLASIINATSSWWDTWRAIGNWLRESMSHNNVRTLQEFVNWTLASNEPPFAALGILCVATCLQQLDDRTHADIIRQLPRPPGELFQEYFDRVHRLIINHNGYSTTKAGIEVIMMTGKTYMNLGLLKMNWILTHRAILHAQLLGFHRPHRSSSDESNSHITSRLETWFSLCAEDVYISLLLNLPYTASWKSISPAIQGAPGTLRFFQYQMIRLSARIIDRNQMGLETSVPATRDIDHEVALAADQIFPAFWDAPSAVNNGMISPAEYMEHLACQFWFFQAKVLIHQPLMIQSIEDHQLLDHRDACLSACRQTLKIYHFMRSSCMSAFSMIKLVDYQAFICSAILLLGLLGYGSHNPSLLPQAASQNKDAETVQSTLDILRRTSDITNNTIASQAVQGIETLFLLINGRASGATCPALGKNPAPSMKIVIPGSGVITISPGKLMTSDASPSSDPVATREPPVFRLTHGTFQEAPAQDTWDSIPQQNTEADSFPAPPPLDVDVSMVDLDWINMIGTDLGGDWAWLAEVNAGGIM